MDTLLVKPATTRKRRRHDPEFKKQIIAASLQPGVSIAAVALANGINTNLLRRWVKEHREALLANLNSEGGLRVPGEPTTVVAAALAHIGTREDGEIRLEVRRGSTTVQIAWPVAQADVLAQWLKDLLR